MRPLAILAALLIGPLAASAADLDEATAKLRTGEYEAALADSTEGIAGRRLVESWWELRLDALGALGRYDELRSELDAALAALPQSLRLRFRDRQWLLRMGQTDAAQAATAQMQTLLASQGWRYRINGYDLITVGKLRMEYGADPREILEGEYALAERRESSRLAALLARGELALQKEDFGLAADLFREARELGEVTPEIPYGLARAFQPSDPATAMEEIEQALAINPRHGPSLILKADQLLDGERYDEAGELLDEALAVNPSDPLAIGYQAVIAHLTGRDDEANDLVAKAVAVFPGDPTVPHAIGRELSRKYRFDLGEAMQRRALAIDSGHLPAKLQLAQDLLRLGRETEGWALAADVAEDDPYNVLAYNLATLRDQLDRFDVLVDGRFRVRMEAAEARIYGPMVLDLLRRAEDELAAKYEVELPPQVFVDIYHRQADFAIRTFGVPGGIGYLGVCFGPVVTMNSPVAMARQLGGEPASWESVLWHEFTHTVTLTKTGNRMPRWLSEGLSVYEETQADPRWGRELTPTFAMQLQSEAYLPPSRLSESFLSGAPGGVQLAYFESYLVVRYLVETFGMESLRAVLDDLGTGLSANDALSRHMAPIARIDADFRAYVDELIAAYAPGTDFTDPEFGPAITRREVESFVEQHPTNPLGLLRLAKMQQAAGETETAYDTLQTLATSFATDPPVEALALRAALEAALARADDRFNTLQEIAARDASQLATHRELLSIALAGERPREDRVREAAVHARDVVSVNPLIRRPHEILAEAAIADDRPDDAIASLTALSELGPFDPAQLHYDIATLCHTVGREDEARRRVLLALEEAPRFRAAHRLLLEIVTPKNGEPETATPRRSDD